MSVTLHTIAKSVRKSTMQRRSFVIGDKAKTRVSFNGNALVNVTANRKMPVFRIAPLSDDGKVISSFLVAIATKETIAANDPLLTVRKGDLDLTKLFFFTRTNSVQSATQYNVVGGQAHSIVVTPHNDLHPELPAEVRKAVKLFFEALADHEAQQKTAAYERTFKAEAQNAAVVALKQAVEAQESTLWS